MVYQFPYSGINITYVIGPETIKLKTSRFELQADVEAGCCGFLTWTPSTISGYARYCLYVFSRDANHNVVVKSQETGYPEGTSTYVLSNHDSTLGVYYHSGGGYGHALWGYEGVGSLNCTNLVTETGSTSAADAMYSQIDNNKNTIMNDILDYEPIPADDDPYSPVGDSEPGGGGGDFDDTSDPIDFPPLPSISVADSGFVSILSPTLLQIQALASYMWTGPFDPTTFKKIVANPLDVFIGMSILPIAIPHSSVKRIKLGGIDTGLDMNLADSQFVDVNFGTLTIKTGTGDSYLDFSPYTKSAIFLPYIGWRDLDIDEIMKKTLSLKYRVDIVSGGCVAMLKCGDSVLYEWSGQCSINIPITSMDWSSTYSAALSAVGTIMGTVSGVAMGGATGNPLQVAGSIINGGASIAGEAMAVKPQYPRSGSLGGPSGVLGHQQAYIVLTRPRLQKPRYQSEFVGYPSFVTKKVSDLVGSGFNAFSEIILEDIGLTDDEMEELKTILKGGVYL